METKKNEITNLSDFCDLINSSEDWEPYFGDIIKRNGWIDETEKTYGICNDGERRLQFNEWGEAEIILIDQD